MDHGTALVDQRPGPPELSFWLNFLCFLNQGISYTVVIPTIDQYTESLGGSAALSGMMVGVFCVSGAVSNIPTAFLLGRMQMKSFLMIAMGLYVVGNAMVGLAGWFESIYALLVGRVIIGLVSMTQVSGAYVARAYDREKRSERMVLNASASGVGCATGPMLSLIGSVICASQGLTGPILNENTLGSWIMALLSAGAGILVLFFFTEPPAFPTKSSADPQGPWLNLPVIVSLVSIARVAIVLASWETHVELVVQDEWQWSATAGAAYLSGIYYVLVPGTMYGKKIATKMKDAQAMKILALAGLPFLILLLNFAGSSVFGIILYTFGSAVMVLFAQLERGFPQSAITKQVPASSQQAALGAFALVWSLSRAAGSSLGTILRNDLEYVLVMIGFGIIELIMLWAVDRIKPPAAAVEAQCGTAQ